LDLETGLIQSEAATPVLSRGVAEDAADVGAISNATIRPCAPQQAEDVALEHDPATGLWRTPHLGIDADSVTLDGGGACEPSLGPAGVVPGYVDAQGERSFDAIDVAGCAEGVTASYAWTSCSLEGEAAWRCPLLDDRDGDPATTELGACTWFLIYEGNAAPPGSGARQFDLRLFLAHGASLHAPFRKYTADGGDDPTLADARIASTVPHGLSDIEGSSWASVPSLYWDEPARLWRVYFTAEVSSGSAQWYAESADDGLTWGVDGHRAASVDCWDAAVGAPDEAACRAVTWAEAHTPADDPRTGRTPDAVDAQVIPWPGPEREEGRVLMLFCGANPRCGPGPRWGSYGAGWHPNRGDASATWASIDAVAADPEHGVLVTPDAADDECADQMHDFTVAEVAEGRYVMLYQPVWVDGAAQESDGVYLSASGYACSNFADDDGDGAVDYGVDDGCSSPLDESE
jgi:hypothetical protein